MAIYMMTNLSRSCALKWLGLIISLISGSINGLPASFNVYAMELKETFNYTQSQVELVSSIALIGMGLAFLHSIILDKFGYKVVYVIIIVTAPVPCVMMYIATMFKSFFSNWAGLVGLFLLLAYLNNSLIYLQLTQIGISKFSKKDVGKVIALYVGFMGLGKVFFCGFHELFFVGNLGGFFLALGCLWTILGVVCFFLHRPYVQEQEAVCGTEYESNGQTESITEFGNSNDITNKCEIGKTDLLKSPYFHMMFWSSIIFFSCFITFMNNLTVFGESTGLENPLVLVYILSITMVISRICVGILYDLFPSDNCGFLCLYLSYFCFMIAMIVGLTWFNQTSVFLMTFLVGVSVAGANTLPLTLLSSRFGSENYSAILGFFQFFFVPTVIILQMFVGHFYDMEMISGPGNESGNPKNQVHVCYGSHCFLWTFVMLLCTSSVVYLAQLLNHLYIHHAASTNH